jgi:hypothetical protein
MLPDGPTISSARCSKSASCKEFVILAVYRKTPMVIPQIGGADLSMKNVSALLDPLRFLYWLAHTFRLLGIEDPTLPATLKSSATDPSGTPPPIQSRPNRRSIWKKNVEKKCRTPYEIRHFSLQAGT